MAGGPWSPEFERPGLNGQVYELFTLGDELIAQGRFDIDGETESVARWAGARWEPLGSRGRYVIEHAAVWNGFLYAVGYVSDAEGELARYLGRWNGEEWAELEYPEGADVNGLASFEGGVFALMNLYEDGFEGGFGFLTESGWSFVKLVELPDAKALLSYHGRPMVVAQSSADSVSVLGFEADSLVSALPRLDGRYVAACASDDAVWMITEDLSSPYTRRLRAWRDAHWASVEPPSEVSLTGLAANGRSVFLFTAPSSYYYYDFSAFELRPEDDSWATIAHSAPGNSGLTAVRFKDELVLGGSFAWVDSVGAQSVAVRGANGWRALGEGLGVDGYVLDLVDLGGALWITGDFQTVGKVWSPGIAVLRDDQWDAVPPPPIVAPWSLARIGEAVQAFARRSDIDVEEGRSVSAEWDGSSWSASPTGEPLASWSPRGMVELAGSRLLYGSFVAVEGQSVPLMELSSEGWKPIVSSLRGTASVAVERAGEVFLAGDLGLDAEPHVGSFAIWDGARARVLPEQTSSVIWGIGDFVNDLAVFGDLILVAGEFDYVGEVYSPGIVAWDGARFRPFAFGGEGGYRPVAVDQILVADETVFATGTFVDEGYTSASGLFLLERGRWSYASEVRSASGRSGITGVAIAGDRLYAGLQQYDRPEGSHLGRWIVPVSSIPSPATLDPRIRIIPNPARGDLSFSFSFSFAGPIAPGARWSIVDVAGRRLAGDALRSGGAVPRVVHLSRRRQEELGLTSGVYYLRVDGAGTNTSRPLVIVR